MASCNLTQLTDNMRYGQCKPLSEIQIAGYPDEKQKEKVDYLKSVLGQYAGQSLRDLQKANPGLIIFPQDASTYVDDVEKSMLFDLRYRPSDCPVIETGNLMGVFGIGDVHISIGSRFDDTQDKPYFMRYLLLRVLGAHVLDLPTHSSADPIDELSIFLFPMALQKALAKGLFKAYRRYEYNDANIKGPVDIARHLRTNIPFRGRVAYATREHTVDNPILQLARHAIEFIKSGPYREILTSADKDVKEAVDQVVAATPSYVRQQRVKVINQNLRPVRHPYFSEYTMLQKISLQILRHEKMSHGDGSDKLSGIVFDGAWLWEEYLNKVMQERLKEGALRHPQNKRHLEPLHIYKPKSEGGRSRKPIYPDFLWCSDSSRDKGQSWDVVLDAKYKRAFQEENGKSHFAVAREDRYQMISYLHLTEAKLGVFICPLSPDEKKQVSTGSSEEEDFDHVDDNYYREGVLLGCGGEIAVVPFSVPSSKDCDFGKYGDRMKVEEDHFCNTLKSVMKGREEKMNRR